MHLLCSLLFSALAVTPVFVDHNDVAGDVPTMTNMSAWSSTVSTYESATNAAAYMTSNIVTRSYIKDLDISPIINETLSTYDTTNLTPRFNRKINASISGSTLLPQEASSTSAYFEVLHDRIRQDDYSETSRSSVTNITKVTYYYWKGTGFVSSELAITQRNPYSVVAANALGEVTIYIDIAGDDPRWKNLRIAGDMLQTDDTMWYFEDFSYASDRVYNSILFDGHGYSQTLETVTNIVTDTSYTKSEIDGTSVTNGGAKAYADATFYGKEDGISVSNKVDTVANDLYAGTGVWYTVTQKLDKAVMDIYLPLTGGIEHAMTGPLVFKENGYSITADTSAKTLNLNAKNVFTFVNSGKQSKLVPDGTDIMTMHMATNVMPAVSNVYTKSEADARFVSTNKLENYYTKEDSDKKFVTTNRLDGYMQLSAGPTNALTGNLFIGGSNGVYFSTLMRITPFIYGDDYGVSFWKPGTSSILFPDNSRVLTETLAKDLFPAITNAYAMLPAVTNIAYAVATNAVTNIVTQSYIEKLGVKGLVSTNDVYIISTNVVTNLVTKTYVEKLGIKAGLTTNDVYEITKPLSNELVQVSNDIENVSNRTVNIESALDAGSNTWYGVTNTYTKAYIDTNFLGKTEKAVSASDSDQLGGTYASEFAKKGMGYTIVTASGTSIDVSAGTVTKWSVSSDVTVNIKFDMAGTWSGDCMIYVTNGSSETRYVTITLNSKSTGFYVVSNVDLPIMLNKNSSNMIFVLRVDSNTILVSKQECYYMN